MTISDSPDKLHDKFFKKIYSQPRYAQDILRLALTADECELFDLDKMTVDKDSTLNPSTALRLSISLAS